MTLILIDENSTACSFEDRSDFVSFWLRKKKTSKKIRMPQEHCLFLQIKEKHNVSSPLVLTHAFPSPRHTCWVHKFIPDEWGTHGRKKVGERKIMVKICCHPQQWIWKRILTVFYKQPAQTAPITQLTLILSSLMEGCCILSTKSIVSILILAP